MPNLIDRTGQRFSRLLVIERDGSKPPANFGKRVYWICECDCGNRVSVTGHELQAGDTKSCGCALRDHIGSLNRTHGYSRTPTYWSWQAAKARCYDPANTKYAQYGGRGISICDRWRNSFEAFLEDMGERPKRMTLDRVNPNGNYEPMNCRWATAKMQSKNRRGVGIEWKGEILTIKEIAEKEGLPRTSLNKALVRLKAIDQAVHYTRAHVTCPPS